MENMFKKLALLFLLSLTCHSFATQATLNIINNTSPGYIYAPFSIGAIVGIVSKQSAGSGCVNKPPAMNACGIDASATANSYTILKYASPSASTYVCLSSSSQLPVDNNHGRCALNDCAAQINFTNGMPVAKPIGGNCSRYAFPDSSTLTSNLKTITVTHWVGYLFCWKTIETLVSQGKI